MRVAHVNMSQSGASCPQGLTRKNMSGLIVCGQSATGCHGTFFSALGLSYSQVCGQLRGYQFGNPDAFGPYRDHGYPVSQGYVDGASITYDTAVPKHIWTYVANREAQSTNVRSCPCNTGSAAQVPPYVGSDYYCESGNNNRIDQTQMRYFFANDTLWDGQQCVGVEAPCCTHPNMPWFSKTINKTTTEDIQLRLCQDEPLGNEETLLQLIALYVQ